MTFTATATETSAEILELVADTPGPWSAAALANYLASLDFLYLAALQTGLGGVAIGASRFTFVRSEQLFPYREVESRRALAVRSLRTGSLHAEFAELVPAAVAGITGGGLIAVARLLTQGPGEIARWAAVPTEVRRRRAEERAQLAQAQLLALEAEQRLREVRSATPSLAIRVRSTDGDDLVPWSRIAPVPDEERDAR